MDHIAGEVRAERVELGMDPGLRGDYIREWDVEGIKMEIAISRVV